MRRAGVFVAVVGTFIAAAEGTVVAWRTIKAISGGARTWAAGMWLVHVLPFLGRSATIHGAGALVLPKLTVTTTATVTPGWDEQASPEARVMRLHELMDRANEAIGKVRQEARDEIDECAEWRSSKQVNCGLLTRLTRRGMLLSSGLHVRTCR